MMPRLPEKGRAEDDIRHVLHSLVVFSSSFLGQTWHHRRRFSALRSVTPASDEDTPVAAAVMIPERRAQSVYADVSRAVF